MSPRYGRILSRRRANERGAGVRCAGSDGGQDAPFSQGQAVAGGRILPAEPVEGLAQEPQVTGIGVPAMAARPVGGRRAEGVQHTDSELHRGRRQAGAGIRGRQVSQLVGGQLAETANSGDPGVLADADQRDALRRHTELGQAGQDMDDL